MTWCKKNLQNTRLKGMVQKQYFFSIPPFVGFLMKEYVNSQVLVHMEEYLC